MKRLGITLTAVALLAAGAFAVAHADEDSSTLVVRPSTMKDGETKTLVDGDRTIKIRKNGSSLDVQIEGAGETRSISISSTESGEVRIDGNGGRRYRVVTPGTAPLIIDGTNFEHAFGTMPHLRHLNGMQNWFVCPKDHSMLRVPEGKEKETFKCPVDGTTMEQRKGRGFAFFFDDDKSEDL
jgi:hypothetical protein